jgi:hypothetical protein
MAIKKQALNMTLTKIKISRNLTAVSVTASHDDLYL